MSGSVTRPAAGDRRPFAAVILGSDTMLAALPATPVQLAHACMAAGFDMAYPASWGDELVAAECLGVLGRGGPEPAIFCACEHVVERLTRAGSELVPWMLRLPAPPVSVARYLRTLHAGRALRITFAGSCPSAADPVIDAVLSPAELFATFAARGIVLETQPRVFDSILPPDRRRYYSLPGGVPSPERLAELSPPRALEELDDGDVTMEMAQHMLSRRDVLIDLAPRAGCACAGALMSSPTHGARAALVALDPPRAGTPVFEHTPTERTAAPAPEPAAEAADLPDVAAGPSESAGRVAARRPRAFPMVRTRDGRAMARAYSRFRGLADADDLRPSGPPPAAPQRRDPPPLRALLEFSAAD